MRYIDLAIVLIAAFYMQKEAAKTLQNIEFKSNINQGIPRCKNLQAVRVEQMIPIIDQPNFATATYHLLRKRINNFLCSK